MNPNDNPELSVTPRTTGKWAIEFPTDAEGRKRWALAGIGLSIIFYAYFISRTCLLGITGSPSVSLAKWLLTAWGGGEDFAHGYLVPFIFGGLVVWKWRTKLHAVPTSTTMAGLPVILAAVLLYWVGVKATNPRILAISSVVLIYGLVLYLGGWTWAKELWFPVVFLMFMIPLDFLGGFALKLRVIMTTMSTGLLNFMGMDLVQEGSGIRSRTGRFEPLDVADPCSGIRSLVALTALASVYGYVIMDKGWKKWVLFISSVPLAVIGNLARIVTIVMVAQGFGHNMLKVYHDYSGFVVFGIAIACMIGLGALMNLNYRELLHHLTKEEVNIPRPQPRRRAHYR